MRPAILTLALAACGGTAVREQTLTFADARLDARAGEELEPFAPSAVPQGAEISIEPALPAGLTVDPASGWIAGTPTAPHGPLEHRVTVRAGDRTAAFTLTITVDAALPAELAFLQPRWSAERVVGSAAEPVRLAVAPDGRVFFCERQTGRIRVIGADGALRAQPFATVQVLNDGHRGLLGLALPPDFAATSELFVAACVPASPPRPDRLQVLRFAAVADLAPPAEVVVDDIPLAGIDVGGELGFDAAGHLLLTVGDLEDPQLAQDPGSPAGKVLRYRRDGSVPADNPDPTSPVLCRGLRNPFALALHPQSGSVLAADNGPDADDRLVFVQAGRDFGWGAPAPPAGAGAGYVIRTWRDVVVPTALTFRGDDLLIAAYVEEEILSFRMSGSARVDIDAEAVLARFRSEGIANKPLCVRSADDGSVWVTTFSAVWRLTSR